MPALRIIHRSSVFQGRELVIDKPVVVFGRDPKSCDVLFDEVADRVVSRQHAQVRWEDGRPVLAPMPGKVVLRHGLQLNGPVAVLPGDVFELAGPGGPSVELRWDAPPASLPHPAPLPPELAEAPTEQQLKPVRLDLAVAPPGPVTHRSSAPPPQEPVTDPATKPVFTEPPAAPSPEPAKPPEEHRTMMLRPVQADDVASTQFLRVDELLPPPPTEQKKRWIRAISVGGAVLVLLALVGVGWGWHAQREARRRAVERVEKLREAFGALQFEEVTEEDWEVYRQVKGDEEADRAAQEARKRQAALEAEKKRKAEEAAAAKAKEEAAAKEKAGQLASLQQQARAAFVTLKKLELERIGLGRSRERRVQARREELDAKLVQARKAYVASVEKVRELSPAGGRLAALLESARHLGECDACLPPAFVSRALAEANRLAGADKASFEAALVKARDHRYTPTLTAALGDQGLPAELFFIPLQESGFDEKKVGEATALGIPKGMWQLAPAVAKKEGLGVGPAVEQAAFDAEDPRHRYERETKTAAKVARAFYSGPAAGSGLLTLAFWSNGDASTLRAVKKKAGLGADDADPARVSLVRLLEKKALTAQQQTAAARALAMVAVGTHPKTFGLSLGPPFQHVEPEQRR